MRFVPLASSSAGNAYIVEEPGGGRLLLECGLTCKRLTRLAGGRLQGLCGCLITHEHGDHAKCWRELIKSGVRVWASGGTIAALASGKGGDAAALIQPLPEEVKGSADGAGCGLRESPLALRALPPFDKGGLRAVDGQAGVVDGQAGAVDGQARAVDGQAGAVDGQAGAVDGQAGAVDGQARASPRPTGRASAGPYIPFSIGPFDVLPFPTFHDDADQPVGYLIRSGGEKLAFATDTAVIHSRFPGVNILALEANYDAAILARCERMPDKVKHRVRNCHMEIGELCRYLQGADLSRCREIWLLHLSSAAASEGDFVRRVREAVPRQAGVYAAPALSETGGQK